MNTEDDEFARIAREQALNKMANNARELGLDYELPITMQAGELDCTHAERLCAELKLAEQPAQQEPIATLWQHGETGRTRITMPGDVTDCDARWFKAADLYTSPPSQRTWVGLTDEERESIAKEYQSRLATALMIEAKLKELNT